MARVENDRVPSLMHHLKVHCMRLSTLNKFFVDGNGSICVFKQKTKRKEKSHKMKMNER